MPGYANKRIGELAHQLRLSPVRLRPAQLEAAERLLDRIDPARDYPYDWVCFHITGYRRRDIDTTLIPGRTLIADLAALIDDLSRSVPVPPLPGEGRIFSLHALAERFNVSTKTITRWRRRGLVGRRYALNGTGRLHLGFSERAVRRFVRDHAEMIQRAAAFKQLDEHERRTIVERARHLVATERLGLHHVSERIAAETGRAVETIRYTLRQHDRERPGDAVFARDGRPALDPLHQQIFNRYEQGAGLDALAREFGMTPDAVRRVIIEVRCRRLLNTPLEYQYSPLFDAPDADRRFLAEPLDIPQPPENEPASTSDQPYFRALGRTPVLSRRQEYALFARYNYLKFKARRLRDALDPETATTRQVDEVEALLRTAQELKNLIIRHNLRLVISIARRHVRAADNLFEIVSDGNLALMRAVEKFDFTRGHKFSTYASWAIMRCFARAVPAEREQARRFAAGNDELLASVPAPEEALDHGLEVASLRRRLLQALTALTPRERTVVCEHFGLAGTGESTLEQIGERLGVTKERVRQIEKRAFRKLREILPDSLRQLLT